MIGNVLDKYEVLQKVGEGGMATVYKGRHVTLGREVAIKVLHPHLSASERNRKRFEREARAIEHLEHDNILRIFDYSGTDTDSCYIVTEFVNGETLQALLNRRVRLPSEIVAMLGIRLAQALEYAHDLGIIHRDLKLENVMIRRDGTLKLMDFGIARFLDEVNLTVTGALVGSPAYMSPEQAMERVLDSRSDLFSLGTLLYHLVTGQLPFSGGNPSIILRNIIEGNRPGVIEMAPDASGELADLIEQLLQVEPHDRPESAREVATRLTQCIGTAGIDTTSDPWSLQTWLVDPDTYEERLTEVLQERLMAHGKSLMEERDHLGALRAFNRLLSIDGQNEEVLQIIRSMHGSRPGDSGGRLRWTLVAGLLSVVGAVAWLLWPEPPAPNNIGNTQQAANGALVEPETEAQDDLAADTLPQVVATDVRRPLRTRIEAAQRPNQTNPSLRTKAPPPDPKPTHSPDPPASVLVTVPGSWGDIYIDGVLKGRTGTVGRIEVSAGTHTIGVSNDHALPWEKNFTVAPGEDLVIEVTSLQRKPARFRLLGAPTQNCDVIVDGVRRGTVGSLNATIRVRTPDQPHNLTIQCADGTNIVRTIGPATPGALVPVHLDQP